MAPYGIIALKLFRYPIFSAGMLVVCMRSVAFLFFFFQPSYCTNSWVLTKIQSGLIMLPGAMVIGLFMPISGK